MGDLDRAILQYTHAIKINPQYTAAYNNRGNVWSDKSEMDQAISDFSHAITVNPQLAEAYTNRGVVWNAKGNLDRAISDYTPRLFQLIRTILVSTTHLRGYMPLTHSQYRDGNMAFKYANRALELAPKVRAS